MTGNLALDYSQQYIKQRLYELEQQRKRAKFEQQAEAES